MDKPKEKKQEQVLQHKHAFQDDVQIAKQVESTPLKLLKGDGIALNPHLSWEDAYKQITGTKDFEVAHNIVSSGAMAILSLLESGKPMSEQAVTCLNIILQNLHDFQPKDAIEASLVAKAAALFQHGMARLSKNELFIKRLRERRKTDKSALLCEGIRLLFEKEIGSKANG
jgi:hypothetical protein